MISNIIYYHHHTSCDLVKNMHDQHSLSFRIAVDIILVSSPLMHPSPLPTGMKRGYSWTSLGDLNATVSSERNSGGSTGRGELGDRARGRATRLSGGRAENACLTIGTFFLS